MIGVLSEEKDSLFVTGTGILVYKQKTHLKRISMQNRTFGVEIEVHNAPHPEVIGWHLNQLGIANLFANYCSDTLDVNYSKYWAISVDQSVRGQLHRLELSSRILCGTEGLKEVRKVINLLVSLGCQVNKTCGLHVHVGLKGVRTAHLVTMLERYSRWEETIDSWMVPARRENKNRYAYSVHDSLLLVQEYCSDSQKRYTMMHSVSNFAAAVDSGHCCKLDFESIWSYKTVEFRQHQGSLCPSEILNWIRFCVNFVEMSMDLTPGSRRSTKKTLDKGPLYGLPSRTKQFYNSQVEKYAL